MSLWYIGWLLLVVVVIITAFFLARFIEGRTYPSAYWKGRSEGWRACEGMVLARAKELGKEEQVWKELVQ